MQFSEKLFELSKILMHKFWFDYVKQKYCEKAKLCYMDTHNFIAYIKTNDIYKNIAEMLKLDMILQIMNQIDHCLKENIKK